MNQIDFYASVTGGKIWQKAGRLRIYAARTNKVQVVFLNFEDGDVESGALLSCFIKDCGQNGGWYRSQREIALRNIGRPLFVRYLAASAFAGTRPYDSQDFTAADVEAVVAVLDEIDDLAGLSLNEERIKNLEDIVAVLGRTL